MIGTCGSIAALLAALTLPASKFSAQPTKLKAHAHCLLCVFPPLLPPPPSPSTFRLSRYAPSYDDLDGGAASEALGFPQLRQRLLQQVCGALQAVCWAPTRCPHKQSCCHMQPIPMHVSIPCNKQQPGHALLCCLAGPRQSAGGWCGHWPQPTHVQLAKRNKFDRR